MIPIVIQPSVWRLPKRCIVLTSCMTRNVRQHTKSAAAVTSHHLTKPKEDPVKNKRLQQSASLFVPSNSQITVILPELTGNCNIGSTRVENKPLISKKNEEKDRNAWREYNDVQGANLHQVYLKLSKIRLTSLVVLTSMAGYAMAPAPFELTTFLMASVGTGLTSCAANSINQFLEVPFDSQMSRTRNRVLVQGKVTPLHAVNFAAVSATLGVSILYFGCNPLTAVLGASNLVLYTMIYTPLKRVSILNTWVGSVVGAIPPLMGWSACTGHAEPAAWVLAALLYAWQFPHFNALSWNLRPDYSRAGYRMMSVTNPGLCRRVAVRYTGAIIALSLAAPYFELTNPWFALESLPLNVYFAYLAYQFYRNSDSGSSRKLFRFSLIHLPALMLLLLVNKKKWFLGSTDENKSEKFTGLLEVELPPVPSILGPRNVAAASPDATLASSDDIDSVPTVLPSEADESCS